MGISTGILALICALVLLFGVQGTRKILGWGVGLLILVAAGVARSCGLGRSSSTPKQRDQPLH